VSQEEAIDCYAEDLDCHVEEEDLDCHVEEEDLDCHVQEVAVVCHGRSARAACRARRKHRQTAKRAERRRKDRQSLRAAIQDNDPEPIYLTHVAQGRNRFNRSQLLGAKVKINGHELVALVDSGCEVELVLSRKLADRRGTDYSHITREVLLPDGTRMTAARTIPISLKVAGSQKELTAIVVDMVAFDSILGLPWLDAANPVVNWRTKRLLLPGVDGPTEVDSTTTPVAREYPTLPYSQQLNYLRLVKKEARCTWPPFALHPK
jgi:predicted aspartyl protease